MLRDERRGPNSRFLWAYVDGLGNLHIVGQDLGPGTASASLDGEYEWFQTIADCHISKIIELQDGEPDDSVLDLLNRDWLGARTYESDKRLRESDIEVLLSTWAGCHHQSRQAELKALL